MRGNRSGAGKANLSQQSDEGSVVAGQAGLRYQNGPAQIGFGAVENVVRGGGNGKMLYGLIGAYQVSDQFSARLGAETQEDSDVYGGGFDTVGLGRHLYARSGELIDNVYC
ncbi:hypothetical protein [Vreelandella olivaria]|uniref:hypothetical protein n=1 Tax=Vreelandella olivaria TaxID=390919 RepID=UPI00201F1FBA|nr:hypothetical protein [Halomonas olivaria]